MDLQHHQQINLETEEACTTKIDLCTQAVSEVLFPLLAKESIDKDSFELWLRTLRKITNLTELLSRQYMKHEHKYISDYNSIRNKKDHLSEKILSTKSSHQKVFLNKPISNKKSKQENKSRSIISSLTQDIDENILWSVGGQGLRIERDSVYAHVEEIRTILQQKYAIYLDSLTEEWNEQLHLDEYMSIAEQRQLYLQETRRKKEDYSYQPTVKDFNDYLSSIHHPLRFKEIQKLFTKYWEEDLSNEFWLALFSNDKSTMIKRLKTYNKIIIDQVEEPQIERIQILLEDVFKKDPKILSMWFSRGAIRKLQDNHNIDLSNITWYKTPSTIAKYLGRYYHIVKQKDLAYPYIKARTENDRPTLHQINKENKLQIRRPMPENYTTKTTSKGIAYDSPEHIICIINQFVAKKAKEKELNIVQTRTRSRWSRKDGGKYTDQYLLTYLERSKVAELLKNNEHIWDLQKYYTAWLKEEQEDLPKTLSVYFRYLLTEKQIERGYHLIDKVDFTRAVFSQDTKKINNIALEELEKLQLLKEKPENIKWSLALRTMTQDSSRPLEAETFNPWEMPKFTQERSKEINNAFPSTHIYTSPALVHRNNLGNLSNSWWEYLYNKLEHRVKDEIIPRYDWNILNITWFEIDGLGCIVKNHNKI